MRADDLDHAIDLQNAVAFGLTGGLHSLDEDEIDDVARAGRGRQRLRQPAHDRRDRPPPAVRRLEALGRSGVAPRPAGRATSLRFVTLPPQHRAADFDAATAVVPALVGRAVRHRPSTAAGCAPRPTSCATARSAGSSCGPAPRHRRTTSSSLRRGGRRSAGVGDRRRRTDEDDGALAARLSRTGAERLRAARSRATTPCRRATTPSDRRRRHRRSPTTVGSSCRAGCASRPSRATRAPARSRPGGSTADPRMAGLGGVPAWRHVRRSAWRRARAAPVLAVTGLHRRRPPGRALRRPSRCVVDAGRHDGAADPRGRRHRLRRRTTATATSASSPTTSASPPTSTATSPDAPDDVDVRTARGSRPGSASATPTSTITGQHRYDLGLHAARRRRLAIGAAGPRHHRPGRGARRPSASRSSSPGSRSTTPLCNVGALAAPSVGATLRERRRRRVPGGDRAARGRRRRSRSAAPSSSAVEPVDVAAAAAARTAHRGQPACRSPLSMIPLGAGSARRRLRCGPAGAAATRSTPAALPTPPTARRPRRRRP